MRNTSSILNFAFNIDNNQQFYNKSGQHKLSTVAAQKKPPRPKSAAAHATGAKR